MTSQIIESTGLLCDIFGAIWMAKGLMRLRDRDIRRAGHLPGASLGGAPPNEALMEILSSSRRDARIGGVLLVVGFIGQLVATWIV